MPDIYEGNEGLSFLRTEFGIMLKKIYEGNGLSLDEQKWLISQAVNLLNKVGKDA